MQHRRRRAAGEEALDLAALGRAAGEPVDDVAHGHAQLDLVVAGLLHVARDRDDLGAGRLAHAQALEPLGAVLDDQRRVAQRLDVVDQRRPLVEALVGGERRLQARVAALALERVEQRGLLAADVGALAAVDHEVEGVLGAEDALAEVALGVGLLDGRLEDVGLVRVLAADEDEALVGPGGDRADDAALDQQVRVLLHQQPVLERAGLGLVGVAAEELVHRALGDEAGLLAHGEAGAAAAAQPGLLELVSTSSGAMSSSALRSDL